MCSLLCLHFHMKNYLIDKNSFEKKLLFVRSVVELLEWNVTFAQDAKLQNDFQDTIHQSSSSKQGTDANIFVHFFMKLNSSCISRVLFC